MKWERKRISEVYAGLYDGPHATPPDSEDGAIFLGISNITPDGHFDFSSIKHINVNDLPRWTKRVTPEAGVQNPVKRSARSGGTARPFQIKRRETPLRKSWVT